VMVFTCR